MQHEIPIKAFLQSHPEGVSEYQLLKYLKTNVPHFFKDLEDETSLFYQHFWLFHQLYTLQIKWMERANEPLFLSISALEIKLSTNNSAKNEIGPFDAVRDFYLNRDNINLSPQEIQAMLSNFWQQFLALDKKSEALKILELEQETEITLPLLKKKYQLLAGRHHPDKGGDPNQFMAIKKAFKQLKGLVH